MHVLQNLFHRLVADQGRYFRFCWVATALLATLAGCITTSPTSLLRLGASTAEIERLLGQPDVTRKAGQQVAYTYRDRITFGPFGDKADAVYLFEDDKLINHGPGEVLRPKSGATSLSVVWTDKPR